MLPIRHKSIFKSRWIALLWAGGIIWSAVEFTGGLPGGATDNNQTDSNASAPADNGSADAPAVQAAIDAIKGLH